MNALIALASAFVAVGIFWLLRRGGSGVVNSFCASEQAYRFLKAIEPEQFAAMNLTKAQMREFTKLADLLGADVTNLQQKEESRNP